MGSALTRPPASSASSARNTRPTPGSRGRHQPRVSGVPERRRRCAVGRDRPAGRAADGPGAFGHDRAGRGAERRTERVKVEIVTKRLEEVDADALVVGLYVGETKLPERLARLDRAAQGQLKRVLDAEKFQGKSGQVTHAHADGRRIVVAGLGPRAETTPEVLRRAAAAGVRRARDLGARTVAAEVLGDRLTARQRAQAVVEGAILGTYTFDRYKREKPDKTVSELRVVDPDARRAREARDGMRRGETFGLATSFARDLSKGPANEVHPSHLARAATELANGSRLDVKVFDRAECRKMGMGAFLGVAAGSEQAPQLLHLPHSPPRRPPARPPP